MLEIKNITKIYETEGFTQKALNNVSVSFRECEFASILGPSGSGKTTFLNIIGGLDHYTSGDLIINGISTKKFKDSDWDSYRNHRVGFVFQNYNLITHQSVLSNVRLALTLSGISKKEAIERSKKALKDVGLEDHMHKRPNQLSGGQMQRVAIARALVNNPDILLADEPTGALDSETSIQIMELLKQISKTKLVVMVTHNPELASKYSNRIINLKDGVITSYSNHYKEEKNKEKASKDKKTSMSFLTALSLSFNNLMTKKARTILVAFAGSIGIIGIALILAVSTGFQNYVDSIQEDTLSSYPLSIMQESTDITGTLLAMQSGNGEGNEGNVVKEQQYLSSMLSNIRVNDIKSFKKYLEDHYSFVEEDLRNVKYSYSVEPLIYTIDATNKLAKLNPSNLFSSMFNSNMMSSFSSMTSIYSQMLDSKEILDEQYDVLAGKWPEKYDEMVIVLSERGNISDLLVYSLGLRDYDELTDMITKIMSGESVDIKNEPLVLTYDDLMNIELKMINPYEVYKYNEQYDVYEDMSEDSKYMQNLYDKALRLKIVGVVAAKEGTTTSALTPGVHYSNELIDYIIDNSSKSEIVKKQLKDEEIDVFSNTRFDSKKNNLDLQFADLVNIDSKKLQEAFNIKLDQNALQKETQGYMTEISNAITTDINPAKNDFINGLKTLKNGLVNSITGEFSLADLDNLVSAYMETSEPTSLTNNLEKNYVIPAATFKATYSG
ncbi:MAG: ABC transporter ATP-binding protein, partial [Bacilli bacterium]|nr:ABC transporter ATP-binding protein [Bacilli bacterium]